MHCTYRVRDTRLLLEANPGELFTFLGPDLVECVCAVRSHDQGDGVRIDAPSTARLNPDAMVPVVVIACRSERGEPEFYPVGYQAELPGAAPIVFLEPTAPLEFRVVENAVETVSRKEEASPGILDRIEEFWGVNPSAHVGIRDASINPLPPLSQQERVAPAFTDARRPSFDDVLDALSHAKDCFDAFVGSCGGEAHLDVPEPPAPVDPDDLSRAELMSRL